MLHSTIDPVGRCQHCNVQIFNRADADRTQDRMAHLCWKCVRPHGVAVLTELAAVAQTMGR
jgi:hypothetical protein